jgi:fructosamine-3-kinase
MSHPREIVAALRRLHLVAAGEKPVLTPLAGGVASDIYRVDVGERCFVVKRALEKLRVTAEWRVPVGRSTFEVGWLETAGAIVPGSVPKILAHDGASGLFAMEFLDPASHPVWKDELAAGRVDLTFAAEVGRRIAAIHAATAGRQDIACRFDSLHIFRPIRLEPYLEATALAHGTLAPALEALARRTAGQRVALAHGDVSPKNILVGPCGPIYLDAECAWYGDPAFDLAFCLNHLMLKCLWVPQAAVRLLDAFDALHGAYLDGIGWEDGGGLEARAAALLPALFLARVDGKSPVEYITTQRDKSRVRRVAMPLIATPAPRLAMVRSAWAAELGI